MRVVEEAVKMANFLEKESRTLSEKHFPQVCQASEIFTKELKAKEDELYRLQLQHERKISLLSSAIAKELALLSELKYQMAEKKAQLESERASKRNRQAANENEKERVILENVQNWKIVEERKPKALDWGKSGGIAAVGAVAAFVSGVGKVAAAVGGAMIGGAFLGGKYINYWWKKSCYVHKFEPETPDFTEADNRIRHLVEDIVSLEERIQEEEVKLLHFERKKAILSAKNVKSAWLEEAEFDLKIAAAKESLQRVVKKVGQYIQNVLEDELEKFGTLPMHFLQMMEVEVQLNNLPLIFASSSCRIALLREFDEGRDYTAVLDEVKVRLVEIERQLRSLAAEEEVTVELVKKYFG